MASNKELMDSIHAIDPSHSLKNPNGSAMNNADLAAELKRLKADAGEEQEPEAPTPPAEPEKKDGYRVAKGKALIVKPFGMLDSGAEIKAEWLPGGDEQLATLIAKGYVTA